MADGPSPPGPRHCSDAAVPADAGVPAREDRRWQRPQDRQWARAITTVNSTNAGPLTKYLATATAPVVLVQEHHKTDAKLATFEAELADLGWRGAWTAAVPSPATSGSQGGTAVLARSDIAVTEVPGAPGGVLLRGRATAALVNWGLPQGLVCVSLYLRTGEGLSAANTAHRGPDR